LLRRACDDSRVKTEKKAAQGPDDSTFQQISRHSHEGVLSLWVAVSGQKADCI
jgi:hypothetical protein